MKTPVSLITRRPFVGFLVAAALSVLAVSFLVPKLTLAQEAPPGPPGKARPVIPNPPPVVDKSDLDVARALLDSGAVSRVDLGNGIVLSTMAGPATRGVTITVGGKSLKLPPDAQLGGLVAETLPPVGLPAGKRVVPIPAYLIERGDARIFVSAATGEFVVVAGRPEQYRFMVEALGQDKQIPR